MTDYLNKHRAEVNFAFTSWMEQSSEPCPCRSHSKLITEEALCPRERAWRFYVGLRDTCPSPGH